MRASKIGFFAILTLPLTVLAVAYSLGSARVDGFRQSSSQAPVAQPPLGAPAASSQQPVSSGPPRQSSRRQAPCWRLAGIAPDMLNQRWHIEDNAKGKIHTVCIDPTLSAEKKREKIHEINEQTEQEIAKIIPRPARENGTKKRQNARERRSSKH